MKSKRIVIKIGTNVLHLSNGKLDYKLISELATQIAFIRAHGHEVLVVSSGAVGAGRELCSVDESSNTLTSHQILASVGQARLIQIYAEAFRKHSTTSSDEIYSAAVSANSTVQVEVKYNITLNASGSGQVASLAIGVETGIFDTTTPAFTPHFANASDVIATGPVKDVILFQTSNSINFNIIASVGGTLQVEYWKVTIVHS